MASRPPVALVLIAAVLLLVEWDSPAVAEEGGRDVLEDSADEGLGVGGVGGGFRRGGGWPDAQYGGVPEGSSGDLAAAAGQWHPRLRPAGVWLAAAFNLTNHMSLFLGKRAVIKATQDTSSWPLTEPSPSYGRGRELPGGRYI